MISILYLPLDFLTNMHAYACMQRRPVILDYVKLLRDGISALLVRASAVLLFFEDCIFRSLKFEG